MAGNTVAFDNGLESPSPTLYAILRDQVAARYWNGTSTEAFNHAHYSTYCVPLTEQGGSGQSGIFLLTVPVGFSDSTWDVLVRRQLGGSPAYTDPPETAGAFEVSGGVVV